MLGAMRPLLVVALASSAACSRPAEPEIREAPSADAGLRPGPDGALVACVEGVCSVVPCPSGECRVEAPPSDAMLSVHVTETTGAITIRVEGETVVRTVVHALPSTGLAAHADVRPRHWPAAVEVRVDDRVGRAEVERKQRFVYAGGREPGPLRVTAFDAPLMLE